MARPEWDIAARVTHRCTLASATTTSEGIVLRFGDTTGEAEQLARLLKQVLVSPRAGLHLRDQLASMLAGPAA